MYIYTKESWRQQRILANSHVVSLVFVHQCDFLFGVCAFVCVPVPLCLCPCMCVPQRIVILTVSSWTHASVLPLLYYVSVFCVCVSVYTTIICVPCVYIICVCVCVCFCVLHNKLCCARSAIYTYSVVAFGLALSLSTIGSKMTEQEQRDWEQGDEWAECSPLNSRLTGNTFS